MLIAVDFDGTIVEHEYPEIGEERPFATDILRRLLHHRHLLMLWTVREGELLDQAVAWCEERGVKFAAVNGEWTEAFSLLCPEQTTRKPDVDLYIDDKCISGLPTWTEIYEIITKGCTYRQLLSRQLLDQMQQTDVEPPSPKWMFWKQKPKDKHDHH